MLYPWQRLPESVRGALLQASSGRVHLLNTAAEALESAQGKAHKAAQGSAENASPVRETLLGLSSGLMQAAFEEHPFERMAAQRLRDLDRAMPFLDGRVRILVNRAIASIQPPENMDRSRLERFAREGDPDALCGYVRDECLDNSGNLFWVGYALYLALREGRYEWLDDLLFQLSGAMTEPLHLALRGESALLQDDFASAAALFHKAFSAVPCDLWLERHAEALLRAGALDQAVAQWDDILVRRPWHVSLWQRRHGYRQGLHVPGNLPHGPGAILLFTWNGGHKIRLTLEALAASHLPEFDGSAQILVLDNGSDDGQTPGILAHWAERLGQRMRVITLPCNIGAPAARNWLLTQPEVRNSTWFAYLDDDLLVPRDWLGHFGTAMRGAPDHPVYGCQILRHHSPRLIQCVDMHMLPPGISRGPAWLGENPVHLQASYHGEGLPDYGQFAYTRPCLHVSGCCHLFRREAMDTAGGFDLRFAPTQVDDFEHDIRLASGDKMPCYHGHLRVHHMQATGFSTPQSLPKAMNAHANHLKLQSLYPKEQAEALRGRCTQTLLQDTIRKQR